MTKSKRLALIIRDKNLRRKNRWRREAFYKTPEGLAGEPFGWWNCLECYMPQDQCVGGHPDDY